mmetsp:Transcript_6970/g.22621  ORF Transcript_6970/g.22621 Transcript_6970/m.22621 type:complete len:212 (-) Transcript_6970:44-679(-)
MRVFTVVTGHMMTTANPRDAPPSRACVAMALPDEGSPTSVRRTWSVWKCKKAPPPTRSDVAVVPRQSLCTPPSARMVRNVRSAEAFCVWMTSVCILVRTTSKGWSVTDTHAPAKPPHAALFTASLIFRDGLSLAMTLQNLLLAGSAHARELEPLRRGPGRVRAATPLHTSGSSTARRRASGSRIYGATAGVFGPGGGGVEPGGVYTVAPRL